MPSPLQASIEEFAADGYTHVECFCPRCRVIRLRPMSWLPKISMGLTLDQLSQRLRCAECGGSLQNNRPERGSDNGPTMPPPPRVKPSPNLGNRNAAMKAPAMPSNMFMSRPKPAPSTITPASQPAMAPTISVTISEVISMNCPPVFLRQAQMACYSRFVSSSKRILRPLTRLSTIGTLNTTAS